MGFDKDARWRISDTNKDFELCNTYPRFLIIPSSFRDEDLDSVAKFRYFRRIPTAVWRHIKNGCFIVRSSQPTVGWFGWFRNELDESLVQSYVNNTMPPNSELINGENNVAQQDGYVDKNDDLCDQNTLVDGEDADDADDTQTPKHSNCNLNQQNQNLEQNLQQKNQNHNNNVQDTLTVLIEGNGTFRLDSPTDLDTKVNNETSTSEHLDSTDSAASNINGNGPSPPDDNISPGTETNSAIPTTTSKMIIIDARSYTAAMANRTKGGGYECSEYYQRCEVQFMNLANIHSIRKSFHAIRSVCEAYSEQSNK